MLLEDTQTAARASRSEGPPDLSRLRFPCALGVGEDEIFQPFAERGLGGGGFAGVVARAAAKGEREKERYFGVTRMAWRAAVGSAQTESVRRAGSNVHRQVPFLSLEATVNPFG